jgi:hypothetical protein
MNLSTHAAVGALVGSYTGNPILAFFAGIISHHLADYIPHTDGGSLNVNVKNYAQDKRIILIVALDLLILAGIAIYLFANIQVSSSMIFGAIGAMVPDLSDNMPFWSPRLRQTRFGQIYHKMHETLHYTIENSSVLWTGVVNQIILIAISLRLLV